MKKTNQCVVIPGHALSPGSKGVADPAPSEVRPISDKNTLENEIEPTASIRPQVGFFFRGPSESLPAASIQEETDIDSLARDLWYPGKSIDEMHQIMREEQARELKPALELLKAKGLILVPIESSPRISTAAVVEKILKSKGEIKGIKDGSLRTYKKRFPRIIQAFPFLPTESGPIDEFLSQFSGDTNSYKQSYYDLLGMIYRYAVRCFALVYPST